MTGTVSGGGAGGCCFDEVPFERMVQCDESHLFCDTCIERLAQEAAFGTAPPILACMHTGTACETMPLLSRGDWPPKSIGLPCAC
eukprot:m.528066 g.528066  ORF g.528066 m.528066 type:complete len:85 (-) comp22015_c0_seq10:1165-1419(-)